jgi:hypothetical protein
MTRDTLWFGHATCRHPSEAKELLGFLAGESARAVYRAKGMQPD